MIGIKQQSFSSFSLVMIAVTVFLSFCFVVACNPLDDIRATYDNRTLLESDGFLYHVARGYEFAKSIQDGYRLDVEAMLTDINAFKEKAYSRASSVEYTRLKDSLTSYYIWTFFETHLGHFIQSRSNGFYEFFTNLYSHIRYRTSVMFSKHEMGNRVCNLVRIRAQRRSNKGYMVLANSFGLEDNIRTRDFVRKLYEEDFTNIDDLKEYLSHVTIVLREWAECQDPMHITSKFYLDEVSDLSLLLPLTRSSSFYHCDSTLHSSLSYNRIPSISMQFPRNVDQRFAKMP